MTKDDRLSFALAIATEAGALAQKMRRAPTGLQTWSKGRLDFVTAADLEVEALLRRKIAERFPGESVLGEEAGLDFEAKGVCGLSIRLMEQQIFRAACGNGRCLLPILMALKLHMGSSMPLIST